MKTPLLLTLPLLLLTGGVAFGQGAADRISTQNDLSRAQTESRFNRLGSDTRTETVVREKVIEVPVRTPRRAGGGAGMTESTTTPAPVRMKRVVVRRTETVTKPAPLRINPY